MIGLVEAELQASGIASLYELRSMRTEDLMGPAGLGHADERIRSIGMGGLLDLNTSSDEEVRRRAIHALDEQLQTVGIASTDALREMTEEGLTSLAFSSLDARLGAAGFGEGLMTLRSMPDAQLDAKATEALDGRLRSVGLPPLSKVQESSPAQIEGMAVNALSGRMQAQGLPSLAELCKKSVEELRSYDVKAKRRKELDEKLQAGGIGPLSSLQGMSDDDVKSKATGLLDAKLKEAGAPSLNELQTMSESQLKQRIISSGPMSQVLSRLQKAAGGMQSINTEADKAREKVKQQISQAREGITKMLSDDIKPEDADDIAKTVLSEGNVTAAKDHVMRKLRGRKFKPHRELPLKETQVSIAEILFERPDFQVNDVIDLFADSGTQTHVETVDQTHQIPDEFGAFSKDKGCQFTPVLVDADANPYDEPMGLSAEDPYKRYLEPHGAHYRSFPAHGSIFAGPWRDPNVSFYSGVNVQIEFEVEESPGYPSFEWEPLSLGVQPWQYKSPPRFEIKPLVALYMRPSTLGAHKQLSLDDAGKPLTPTCLVGSVDEDDGTTLTLLSVIVDDRTVRSVQSTGRVASLSHNPRGSPRPPRP